jgi:hypothetical protein
VARFWYGVEGVDAVQAQANTIYMPSRHVTVHRDIDDIETRRRDFKADEPELYAYIEALIAARELERAGGDASGAQDGYGAANRVWHLAGTWRARRDALRAVDKPAVGDHDQSHPDQSKESS